MNATDWIALAQYLLAQARHYQLRDPQCDIFNGLAEVAVSMAQREIDKSK